MRGISECICNYDENREMTRRLLEAEAMRRLMVADEEEAETANRSRTTMENGL